MTKIPKFDVGCIGVMIAIILTAAGYWAISFGWIWLVVAAIVVGSMLLILFSSRKRST